MVVAKPDLFPATTPEPGIAEILAMPRLQSSERWPLLLTAIGSAEPVQQEPCLSFSDSTHLLEAARQGYGVALTRISIADTLVRRGDLRILKTPKAEHPSHYYLVWPRRSRTKPQVERFLEWLEETVVYEGR